MTSLYVLAEKLTAPEVPVGGVSTQSVVLDSIVFVLGIAILGGLLAYIGKRIFTDPR